MSALTLDPLAFDESLGASDVATEVRRKETLLKTGALQNAILNSANFSIIATDEKGVIQLFNIGAERMLGYASAEVLDKITPADISDPQEVIARAEALSLELGTTIAPGFEALAFKASRGIEDKYELTYIRKDGSRFPAVVSVTALRDAANTLIGYLLIGTDNTARKQAEEALLRAGALQTAIFNSANFSSIATDAKGVIQIFNVGAERMLGYAAAEVMDKITPADISDPQEVIARARTLSTELGTLIEPGFQALAFKASRGIEDIYELTYIRKDGSRFPAVVSVTALRDAQSAVIGYLLIGTDNTARKAAEEALLRAGALQTAIFNSANFSSIATDAKGVIQIFNVGAERMLGYTAAEVMDKITPADISDPQEVIARARTLSTELGTLIEPGFQALAFKASRGIEDIYELTYIRKDGSRFPAVVSVTALRDAQSAVIGYLLIGTDNTARRQAEEKLRWTEESFRLMVESVTDCAIVMLDPDGLVVSWNSGADRIQGYRAEEIVGQHFSRFYPELDIADGKPNHDLSTAASGGRYADEGWRVRKDGSAFWANVAFSAIRDQAGNARGFAKLTRDLTSRKQAEAAQTQLDQRLRDQQFYTRSLIESNIDAIMTTDPQGTITDVNEQMEALTGYTRDELINTPFRHYFNDPDRAAAGIDLVLHQNKVRDYELTARHRDGQETVVSFNASTFYNRDRELQGVFAAARDVTERKRLDQTLLERNVETERAKAAAEKANLAKSDFLSSMSHELRSPLNAILGFAQLINSDTPPPTASQADSIDQILHAGWYLLELINEILDLAQIESGRLALSLEPTSLGEVMLECRAMIEPQGALRGITMTFPDFPVPCFVEADRTRLKQILVNLLSNAIKYNKANGQVHVECTEQPSGAIRISVKDTGAGLPPNMLTQLFQPFNRLGKEKSGEEGTGIGLVVSKRLVELMGGTIGVESTVDSGSVFWFELKATSEPTLAPHLDDHLPNTPAAVASNTTLHTLLYVEDNPANLKLVQQLIARRPDLRLLTATDGTRGIALARANRPVVILMDINLPGISGIEALRILRDDPFTAHIPVVAISANAMPRDIEKGLEAGFFRYLTKPIRVPEFMSTLDETLTHALAK